MDIELFRSICKEVSAETDPEKLAILKERLRTFLLEQGLDSDKKARVM
jgi:hypothetical protein